MRTNMQQVTHFMNPDENEIKKSLGTVKCETLSDRDAGFCSGEETDLDTEFHSPTDTSRDSSDTKDYSEHFPNKNKRKCAEPRKVADIGEPTESKMIKLEHSSDRGSPYSVQSEFVKPCVSPYIKEEICNDVKPSSPFRPWSCDRPISQEYQSIPSGYVPQFVNHIQEEPLSLVVEKKPRIEFLHQSAAVSPDTDSRYSSSSPSPAEVQDLSVNQRPQEVVRIRDHEMNFSRSPEIQQDTSNRYASSSSNVSTEEKRMSSQSGSSQQQRNYKNMTRERRIEANARERTRVHTISAAFETLRKCVPAYANNQKLSKLSVLRIACSYIMTLSRIAGYDYSSDQSEPSLADCIESVCNTIQMEGKTRKKKDD